MRSSFVAALLAASWSWETHAKIVVHETAPYPLPSGWKYTGPAAESQPLSLAVALKQPGLQELRARLDEISNPSHQDYGLHVSRDVLSRYQAVPQAAVQKVVSWLGDNAISEVTVDETWIHFNATVGQVESLMRCEVSRYLRDGSSAAVYRAKQYSLPEELLDSIDYVSPLTQFWISNQSKRSVISNPIERRSRSKLHLPRAAMPASCATGDNIDPTCVTDLYNITYIPPDNLSNSSLGIAGFLEQYPGLDYIHDFLSSYSPRRNTTGYTSLDYNFTTISVNGGSAENQGDGAEANLDMVCSMPYVQPLPVHYFSTGGRGAYVNDDGVANNGSDSPNEPWIPFLEYMIAQESVPQVLSISYTDDEQTVPRAYANRVCDLFMQLTSRGVSVLVASGDGGEAGTATSSLGCYANDGYANQTRFIPTFPASCPYVTSVGATASYSTTTGDDLSAGGFSNFFGVPTWQQNATSTYIAALNGSHAGWYNASGRGIPDVAAIGSWINIGGGMHTKGTSASSPIVASIITLINDKRLRTGKPSLGFLNPLLYSGQLDDALTDSTDGSGGSCSWGDGNVELGFDALPGWDPVTGMGTMNMGIMLELLA